MKAHPALFEGRRGGRGGAKNKALIIPILQLTCTFKTLLQCALLLPNETKARTLCI